MPIAQVPSSERQLNTGYSSQSNTLSPTSSHLRTRIHAIESDVQVTGFSANLVFKYTIRPEDGGNATIFDTT